MTGSAEKENLCLYGLPNETWEVNLPAEEVPAELPEPALGINFARDGMAEKDWLSLVAVHSDAWLLSVAFYFGARFGFDKEARYFSFSFFVLLPIFCWLLLSVVSCLSLRHFVFHGNSFLLHFSYDNYCPKLYFMDCYKSNAVVVMFFVNASL